MVVQGGGYGEHRIDSFTIEGSAEATAVNGAAPIPVADGWGVNPTIMMGMLAVYPPKGTPQACPW